jgi:hypothetical protein
MGLELLLICRVGLMFHHLSTSGSNIAQKMGFSLKIPKKSWSISQIIIFPQKLLAFLVFLSDHQTPPQCWASPTSGGALATGAHSVKLLSQLGAGCHHLLGGT